MRCRFPSRRDEPFTVITIYFRRRNCLLEIQDGSNLGMTFQGTPVVAGCDTTPLRLPGGARLSNLTSLRAVDVDEDPLGRASRLDQSEAARWNAGLEEPLSFAEHHRSDPQAMFVDELGGDQRLQQFTAALDMQRRPIRRLQPADFIHDITAYVLRVLPVERT